MKSYFNECTTIDQAKNLFRQLCKELHPDTSGKDSGSEFITMFNEFKRFKPSGSNNTANEQGFNAAEFYDIIKNFDGLQDIKISFVGSFIWLEDEKPGATYLQREKIKATLLKGFNNARFASVKKSWYFSPQDYSQKGSPKKSLEQIKKTYGCKVFKPSQRMQLA